MDSKTIHDSNYALLAPEHMNIQAIDVLAHEWRRELGQRSGNLDLDLSQVETLSTPGIQLLIALATALKNSHRALRIITISDAAHAACRDSGFLPLISQWMQQEQSHA